MTLEIIADPFSAAFGDLLKCGLSAKLSEWLAKPVRCLGSITGDRLGKSDNAIYVLH